MRLAPPATPIHVLMPEDVRNLEAVYQSVQNGRFIRLVAGADGLHVEGGSPLIARSSAEFVTASGQHWGSPGGVARRFAMVSILWTTRECRSHVRPFRSWISCRKVCQH